MKRAASAIFGVAVSAALLFLAFRRIAFSELLQAAARLNALWLCPIAGMVATNLGIRALRWRLLLSSAEIAPSERRGMQAQVWTLYRLEAVGLALNNVLVFRLGELARSYLAHAELRVPLVYALATILVERALDMAALLALFGMAAAAHPEVVPAALPRLAGLGALGLLAALAAVSFVDRGLQRQAAWASLLGRLPLYLQRPVTQAAMGSRALRRPAALFAAAALSLVLWMLEASIWWMAGRAMGIGATLGYGRSVVVLSTAAAASAVPAAPGAFGPFEQFVKVLLVQWGVAEPTALAYAIIVHLAGYILVTVLGIVFLYRMGHGLLSIAPMLSGARKAPTLGRSPEHLAALATPATTHIPPTTRPPPPEGWSRIRGGE